MRVAITQEIIDRSLALQLEPNTEYRASCPIALALGPGSLVGATHYMRSCDDTWKPLTTGAKQFIWHFDNNQKVYPCEIEIDTDAQFCAGDSQ